MADPDSLDTKLADVARQYDALGEELAQPATAQDPAALKRLGKELARLEPVVAAYRELRAVREELAGARQLRDVEADEELRAMAREEVAALEARETALLEELKVTLLPRDPNDDRNVIVEIRAGAGGEEAALFAAELLRMYVRWADAHRFGAEVMSLNETGIGGVKEAILEVTGDGAYSRLKFEGGVHRVQRVPSTESSGRIHTSTATVIVLPEADELEVTIDEERDLRIDVKRASGPGGQSVNTTDSAVRITHLPTGLVVEIQDEKSQHKNKAKALAVLRSRLYDLELAKQRERESAERRTMVQAGDRSEKIRTYNFPDNRVTDHRIGHTIHNVPGILEGNLDPLIDALVMADQAERLRHLTEGVGFADGSDGAGGSKGAGGSGSAGAGLR
jgi:peptide chain release factor 1